MESRPRAVRATSLIAFAPRPRTQMIAPPDVVNPEGELIVARITATLLSNFSLVVLGATATLRPSLTFSQHIGRSSKYAIPLLWLVLFSRAAPGADAQAPPPTALWRVAPMPCSASGFMPHGSEPPLASDVEQPGATSDDVPWSRRRWPEGSAATPGQHGRAMQSSAGFKAAAMLDSQCKVPLSITYTSAPHQSASKSAPPPQSPRLR